MHVHAPTDALADEQRGLSAIEQVADFIGGQSADAPLRYGRCDVDVSGQDDVKQSDVITRQWLPRRGFRWW